MKRILSILALAAAPFAAAQTTVGIPAAPTTEASAAARPAGVPWSLNDCIDYALENNIDVRQRTLQVERGEVSLSTARWSRLPSVSASISGNASFGRALSSDNIYRDNNQTSGSFGVSGSLPIFQGMRINREIEGSKLDLAAAVQDLRRAREDVAVNVMTLYLQVLFTRELADVARRQTELSDQQVERSRQLVESGKQPESARYESEALAANDRLAQAQADNNLQLALLSLSQALNRESAAGFDVVTPVFDSLSLESLARLGTIEEIYAAAADERPHLQAEQLRLRSSENDVRIARSALYPTISASGGYGTSIYDGDPDSFWSQFRHKSSEYVGVSMNIPIFNRRATRNNIRTAQIAVRNQQLALTHAEQSLRKEIEQAWYNADAAYVKYRAAEAALASARTAFEYAEQKAEAGRSTLYDFNDAKTRMEKAESDLVQAKYEFVFRAKILDYYRGEPLRL